MSLCPLSSCISTVKPFSVSTDRLSLISCKFLVLRICETLRLRQVLLGSVG
jgi:hypothetical protein